MDSKIRRNGRHLVNNQSRRADRRIPHLLNSTSLAKAGMYGENTGCLRVPMAKQRLVIKGGGSGARKQKALRGI